MEVPITIDDDDGEDPDVQIVDESREWVDFARDRRGPNAYFVVILLAMLRGLQIASRFICTADPVNFEKNREKNVKKRKKSGSIY